MRWRQQNSGTRGGGEGRGASGLRPRLSEDDRLALELLCTDALVAEHTLDERRPEMEDQQRRDERVQHRQCQQQPHARAVARDGRTSVELWHPLTTACSVAATAVAAAAAGVGEPTVRATHRLPAVDRAREQRRHPQRVGGKERGGGMERRRAKGRCEDAACGSRDQQPEEHAERFGEAILDRCDGQPAGATRVWIEYRRGTRRVSTRAWGRRAPGRVDDSIEDDRA